MPDRKDVEDAVKGNPSALRRLFDRILQREANLEKVLGVSADALTIPSNKSNLLFQPPDLAAWRSEAHTHAFQFFITNPISANGVPLIHNLQASPALPFEVEDLITDYGETFQTIITIIKPSSTLFWRIRSRYPNGQFNAWQVGPEALSSEP